MSASSLLQCLAAFYTCYDQRGHLFDHGENRYQLSVTDIDVLRYDAATGTTPDLLLKGLRYESDDDRRFTSDAR